MKALRTTMALACIVLGSSVHAANLVPNRLVDIKFNGFCDGMRLNINHTTGVVTGTVLGSCVSGTIIGTVGGNSAKGIGVTVMSRTFLYVIDDWTQTWQLYTANGVLFQSGTWSLGFSANSAAEAGSSATGN